MVNVDWDKLGSDKCDICGCKEPDYCGNSKVYCDVEQYVCYANAWSTEVVKELEREWNYALD